MPNLIDQEFIASWTIPNLREELKSNKGKRFFQIGASLQVIDTINFPNSYLNVRAYFYLQGRVKVHKYLKIMGKLENSENTFTNENTLEFTDDRFIIIEFPVKISQLQLDLPISIELKMYFLDQSPNIEPVDIESLLKTS